MKKFMIRCDIEGVSGVVSYDQADPGKPEYSIGKKYFMSDLLAVVNGLIDGGADEIHIYDEHCEGRNIELEKLPQTDKVVVYAGKPPYTAVDIGGLDGSFTGLILVGFHSKRGSKDCLLQHSYEPDIKNIVIDGKSVGEIGMESMLASDMGVPLVMITADSEGIYESKEFGGENCRYVCVKQSLSEFGGICYPLSYTAKLIYDNAKIVAGADYKKRKVNRAPRRNLEVEFFDTPFAKEYLKQYGKPEWKNLPLAESWAIYQARKVMLGEQLKEK